MWDVLEMHILEQEISYRLFGFISRLEVASYECNEFYFKAVITYMRIKLTGHYG